MEKGKRAKNLWTIIPAICFRFLRLLRQLDQREAGDEAPLVRLHRGAPPSHRPHLRPGVQHLEEGPIPERIFSANFRGEDVDADRLLRLPCCAHLLRGPPVPSIFTFQTFSPEISSVGFSHQSGSSGSPLEEVWNETLDLGDDDDHDGDDVDDVDGGDRETKL